MEKYTYAEYREIYPKIFIGWCKNRSNIDLESPHTIGEYVGMEMAIHRHIQDLITEFGIEDVLDKYQGQNKEDKWKT